MSHRRTTICNKNVWRKLCRMVDELFSYHPPSTPSEIDACNEVERISGHPCLSVVNGFDDVHFLVFPDKGGCEFYGDDGRGRYECLLRLNRGQENGLWKIAQCGRFTSDELPCGYCPRCLWEKSREKVLVNNRKKLGRQRRLLVELEDWRALSNVHRKIRVRRLKLQVRELNKHIESYKRNGWAAKGQKIERGKLKAKLKRIDEWSRDWDAGKRHLEGSIAILEASRNWSLADSAWLIHEGHWFLSIATPEALRAVFDVRDDWMPRLAAKATRRAPERVKRAMSMMAGWTGDSVTEFLRELFKRSMAAAVKSAAADVELSMLQQVHFHGRQHRCPDQHFLICKWGLNENEKFVRVELDEDVFRGAVEETWKVIAETARWGFSKWFDQTIRRRRKFLDWEASMQEGVENFLASSLSPAVVDLQVGENLLELQWYMRRELMGNVGKLWSNGRKIKMRYFQSSENGGGNGLVAELDVFEFFRRLAGQDKRVHRSLMLEKHGVYRKQRRWDAVEEVRGNIEQQKEERLNRFRSMTREEAS